jgi:uncharacterized protein YraI
VRPRPTEHIIPPPPRQDFLDFFTASKLGIAAALVVLAAVLGIVLADQATGMAATSTISLRTGEGSPTIVVGHS